MRKTSLPAVLKTLYNDILTKPRAAGVRKPSKLAILVRLVLFYLHLQHVFAPGGVSKDELMAFFVNFLISIEADDGTFCGRAAVGGTLFF